MCLGLGNGCVPKEELTVIACEKCGRSWQVTESVAKRFTEQDKGICPNCRLSEEKKAVSLLKRKTNNDKINEMSIEEKAEFIGNGNCDYCAFKDIDCQKLQCKDGIKQWLESEAE